MTTLQERSPTIDQRPEELRAMPKERRNEVMKKRREIIRALCDKVVVYADKRVRIEGVLDGTEAAQFELTVTRVWQFPDPLSP
jgi:hypothetical protein